MSCRRREGNHIGTLGGKAREANVLRLGNAVLPAQVAVGFHSQCRNARAASDPNANSDP